MMRKETFEIIYGYVDKDIKQNTQTCDIFLSIKYMNFLYSHKRKEMVERKYAT